MVAVALVEAVEARTQGQVGERHGVPLRVEAWALAFSKGDAAEAGMGVEGVHTEDTCAGAFHRAERRRGDSNPLVRKASFLPAMRAALSYDGLCVPGGNPGDEDPDDGNPDIRGSSRLVGLLQKEDLG